MSQNKSGKVNYFIYISFSANTHPCFNQSGWNFLMGTQETFTYWLGMKNYDFGANFKILYFGRKISVAAQLAQKGLEAQTPTKKFGYWMDLLSQPLSRSHVLKVSRPDPELDLCNFVWTKLTPIVTTSPNSIQKLHNYLSHNT